MATPSLPPLLLLLSLFSVLASPSLSLTCTTEKFSNRVYANCTDLPQLGAHLHYTYNASNASLAIAYVATPSDGGAWVAWAINPAASGMVGSQALMALKTGDGSVLAKTYNISSYRSIVESKLSFDVWDLSAEEANGTLRIFASVKIPANATRINQVWQVGGTVNGSTPSIHPLNPANKESKSELVLALNSVSPAPAPAPAKSGSSVNRKSNVGLLMSVMLSIAMVFMF